MAAPKPVYCPLCRKAAHDKFTPFCSQRCSDVDLGRWLGGRYRVETDEKEENKNPPEDDE